MEGQKASPSVIIIYPTLIIATRDSTPYFLSEKVELKKINPGVSLTLPWEEITCTIILWDFLNYLFLLFKAQ